jgi:Tfp pilus assembly protein PilV
MSARTSSLEQRGGTLLEALVALTLMAVAALGVMSSQWWMARGERALAMRERAAFVVDSVAEAVRGSTPESAALAQWGAYAADLLPRADVSVREQGDGLSLSIVRWAAPSDAMRGLPDGSGPGACAAAGGTVDAPCAALAFVR